MKKAFVILTILLGITIAFAGRQTRKYVRPSDTVNVTCDEEQALNKQYTVSKDGFVIMQYVGAVQIAGLTEEGAATKIGQALVSERILPKASVTCEVVGSKHGVISFSGACQNPGETQPKPGMKLSDIVDLAQPTQQANMQRVRIVTAAGHEIVANFAAYNGSDNVNNPDILIGDSVFFDSVPQQQPVIQPVPAQPQQPIQQAPVTPIAHPAPQTTAGAAAVQDPNRNRPQQPQSEPMRERRGFVTVQGAVGSPTAVDFHEGLTISVAIAHAGGLLKDSDNKNVHLNRKIDGRTCTSTINEDDIDKGYAGDVMLRAGDVIDVPYKHRGRGLTPLEKIGGGVLLFLILVH